MREGKTTKKKPRKINSRSRLGSDNIPSELSTEDLQWFWPVTRQAIAKQIEKKTICRQANGKFKSAETLKALLAIKNSNASERFKEAKAEMIEMDLAVKKRELNTLQEQEDWLRDTVGTMINELDAVAPRCAKFFPELNPIEAQERLRKIYGIVRENLEKHFAKVIDEINAKKTN